MYNNDGIANCLQSVQVKNFENRSIIGEDIDKCKVARFLWCTPTVYYVALFAKVISVFSHDRMTVVVECNYFLTQGFAM